MSITRIEQEVINAIKEMGHCVHFDEHAAKILTIIFLSSEPISMSQIVQKSSISKTNVFLKLKKIEEAAIIKKFKQPGTKEFFYYIDKDISNLIIEHMKKKYEEFIVSSQLKIQDILSKYKKVKNLSAEEKNQLKILTNYYKKNAKLLKILRKFFTNLSEKI